MGSLQLIFAIIILTVIRRQQNHDVEGRNSKIDKEIAKDDSGGPASQTFYHSARCSTEQPRKKVVAVARQIAPCSTASDPTEEEIDFSRKECFKAIERRYIIDVP